MAYDKIIVIHSRLDRCLDYVQNDGKTDLGNAVDYICDPVKAGFQTAINCTLDKSFLQMQETKRHWDKHGGILGYHIIHSYAPGEVTPEQAHEAGVEFARRLLGDKYEAVVCTHTDRDHLHCHIVFNSVSFMDGKKYRSDFKSYFHDLRGISNEVSRERGYSVIEPDGKGASYAAWNAEKCGSGTIRDLIRRDIDAALAGSLTYDTFLETLRRQGYSVKRSPNVKHTAVRTGRAAVRPRGKSWPWLYGSRADATLERAAARTGTDSASIFSTKALYHSPPSAPLPTCQARQLPRSVLILFVSTVTA